MVKRAFLYVLLCWSLAGCASLVIFGAGTVAGVGAYKYYQGALTVMYQAPYRETWDATLKALENLKFPIKGKKHDLTAGKIEASDRAERPVKISIKYRSAQETEVEIRIGVLGDQDASMMLKDEIRKELFK